MGRERERERLDVGDGGASKGRFDRDVRVRHSARSLVRARARPLCCSEAARAVRVGRYSCREPEEKQKLVFVLLPVTR